MPQRDQKLYIEDILDSAEAINEFTKEMLKDFRNFMVHEYFGVDAQKDEYARSFKIGSGYYIG